MAGSSIKTRIVSAAAIDTSCASSTGCNAAVFLKKKKVPKVLFPNKLLDQTISKPDQFLMYGFCLFYYFSYWFCAVNLILPFSNSKAKGSIDFRKVLRLDCSGSTLSLDSQ